VKRLINKYQNISFIIILCLLALTFNFYYGYRGVFPIDSFLIFEAGYNIYSGYHPFKDYWLITGPFLDYIQSLFFLIFGINWFSYILHASFINAALAFFSFYFFSSMGLPKNYSLIYSLGVALLAYPSIGSPFIDHHAVIFSVMVFYSLSLGILLKRNLFWFLIPIFLFFSFFSKQIPSAYLVFLVFVVIGFYFFKFKNVNKNNLIFLFYGILFSLLILFLVFFINEIPVKNFLTQYIFYPLTLGDQRINALKFDFNNTINQFKFIYFSLIPLIICLFFLIKEKNKNFIQKEELTVAIFFLGSIMIFIYCQLLTKNQILIFFLIPISAAISHAYILKYFNKKYLIYFVLIIFIFSSFKYHIRFNQNKKFMELSNVNINMAVDAGQIDKRLSGLKWITPEFKNNPQEEINLLIDTKKKLFEIKEKKIFITDYQFLSSLLKNKSPSPNKWYDYLSVPDKENQYYDEYKNFFLSKVKKNEIKYLFFIGKNKHSMAFFNEIYSENNCIVSKKLNEILIEFNIDKCRF
tara:strand:- start:1716 stop:3284 length:1569 start_codon:yes stop_codon:yes gene_type:complete